MSTTGSKIGLAILVIILIAIGVWYATTMKGNTPGSYTSTDVSGQVANTNASNTPAPTIRPTPPTSIDEDMVSIDAQLKAMDSDSQSMDASLNDQPISQ